LQQKLSEKKDAIQILAVFFSDGTVVDKAGCHSFNSFMFTPGHIQAKFEGSLLHKDIWDSSKTLLEGILSRQKGYNKRKTEGGFTRGC